MIDRSLLIACCLLGGLLMTCQAAGPQAGTPAGRRQTLIEFGPDFDPAAVEPRDAKITVIEGKDGRRLRLITGHNDPWPGIKVTCAEGAWDLSGYGRVAVEVRNAGTAPAEVFGRLDNPGGDGKPLSLQRSVVLDPGEEKTLVIPLARRLPEQLAGGLVGMRGFPGGLRKDGGVDPEKIQSVKVFVAKPSENHRLELAGVYAAGGPGGSAWIEMGPEAFFPMIDTYGQFIHDDWPGKIEAPADFKRRKEEEAQDLRAHSGPERWNRYGGWLGGPQLEATGHFRAQKHRGKWWLVDPEGRLFWSHGIDCVRSTTGATPITHREHYFAELPGRDSAFAEFFGRSAWAPHGYYQGKRYETYNLTGANLLRKYGPEWKGLSGELCHRRLRSWGMNTIANWSDPEIYLMRKTPYVATVSVRKKPLEGSTGYWGKFPDVFDPGFREALDERLAAEKGKSAGDPWCIGYFVDNELAWGDEVSLALATLASPPGQAAKGVFLDDLEAKYGSIGRLNEAWGTEHASFDALLESQTPPDKKKAYDDLAEFYTKTAEQYFRVCREAVKRVAPETLYMGCRFAWVNDRAVRAAAKYCDIVSFNRYRYTVADFRLPEGLDKPAVIGEFHFGALDRGMFHTGLRAVADQAERAATYTSYVEGALTNPWLVGTHWFQYGDQATTGRGDGENYQIGFLDVCDTPYRETVAAARAIGRKMYRLRDGHPVQAEGTGTPATPVVKEEDAPGLFTFIPSEKSPARIEVDCGRRAELPVNRLLYGKFTEHLGRNVYHGMWAQLVRNPGFEGAEFWGNRAESRCSELADRYGTPELLAWFRRGLPLGWSAYGEAGADYAADPEAYNSGHCLRIRLREEAASDVGIRQPLDLPLDRQRSYAWSLSARADRTVELVLRLGCADVPQMVCETSVTVPKGGWQELHGNLRLPEGELPAGASFRFEVGLRGPGTVWLDQCLLFPQDHRDGWDPEIVRLVAESKLPILRWPGGNFVSGYHFKDGIGPLVGRPTRLNRPWRAPEPNHVGTDEFMRFCELAGCEPMICLNAGDGTVEEAADWVEYCNGSDTTPMGRLRAANGHPEPYGVRYWEVGNELYGSWQIGHCTAEEYARRYRVFAEAMRERDPSIRLIANGHNLEWNRPLVEQDAEVLGSVSVHTLIGGGMPVETPPEEVWWSLAGFPWQYRHQLDALSDQLRRRVPGGTLAITELQVFTNRRNLPNNGGLAEALFWAGVVHTAVRAGDRVEMITHSALVNHGGGLRKLAEVIYANPVFLARRLYSRQPGRWPVAVRVEGPAFSTERLHNIPAADEVPTLDVLPLVDDAGETLVLLVINRHAGEPVQAEIRLRNFTPSGAAVWQWITGDDILAANSLEAPDAVAIQQRTLRPDGRRLRATIPPRSVSVIQMDGGG